ncbi:hypothetical protein c7_L715 [Megavirus courdo7]|uniref:Uncharacterized protein n=1 Tax=Megavirus courdo7 TaxID=1128135 RepID=H2EBK5_9VIRU|nr:hypothetical protein c7_L715 [Megavirus courdo7]
MSILILYINDINNINNTD